MKSPLVSVIIPFFNQGMYIDETLESVRSQTYPNIEVYIINDGSTDPASVLKLESLKDKGLNIIHSKNMGVCHARNLGINTSAGKYILPLDADDIIAREYIEKAVKILEDNQAIHVVYCEAEFFGKRRGHWPLPPYDSSGILLDNMVFNCAMFRRKDLKETGLYNANMHSGWEDWDLWLSFVEKEKTFYRIPEILFRYRIRTNSRTDQMDLKRKKAMYAQLVKNHLNLFTSNIDLLIGDYIDNREKYRELKSKWPIRWLLRIKHWFKKKGLIQLL